MRRPGILPGFLSLIFLSCQAQQNQDASSSPTRAPNMRSLGSQSCEDCELMFVNMPDNILSSDTTDGWFEPGQKLKISGTVLQPDQETPAPGVIVYYYHTDQKGYYAPGNKPDAGSHKHGRLRGWVKTGVDGQYSIYTSRPAQYPDNKFEAHIHVIIKESDLNSPYWIDEWVFDDDPLLTPANKSRMENRGGSGVLEIKYEGDLQVTYHDIILGLNIPGYPASK